MKKFIFLFILLTTKIGLANANVACVYFSGPQGWLAGAWFFTVKVGDKTSLGSISVGIQDYDSGDALCSRNTGEVNDSAFIFEQAYYLVQEDGFGPDPQTCDYASSKPIQTVKRYKVNVSQGGVAHITAPSLQIIHYRPTSTELSLWQNSENIDDIATQRCVELLPGSVAGLKKQNNLKINIF